MGHFQNQLTAQHRWIHELARLEMHPETETLIPSPQKFDPQQLVEEDTIVFLTELREQLNEFTKIFNSYADQKSKFQEIKIYSLTQGAADFMLFRNQIKLIFSNMSHGVIQISFSQHIRGTLTVDGHEQKTSHPPLPEKWQTADLLAQIGPFRDVFWTYQGEKVIPAQMTKFYFLEFTKITREYKQSTPGNQALLKQIKALLQEKGLNL